MADDTLDPSTIAGSMAQSDETALAKPYEPTAREKAALAVFEKRRQERIPMPAFRVSKGTKREPPQVTFHHADQGIAYELHAAAVGTRSQPAYINLVQTLTALTLRDDTPDEGALNAAISMIAGIEPQDQLESMLASQMVAVHLATMKTAVRLKSAETVALLETYEKAFNKLARTFAAQMEALKRYRSKGEQRVYVERVNVERGGQAVVGNVTHGGGGDAGRI